MTGADTDRSVRCPQRGGPHAPSPSPSPTRPRVPQTDRLRRRRALAAALALAAPGQAGATAGFTVTPLKFTVQAGGRKRTVDGDRYRPSGADRARPVPAVLTTNGFGGSKADGSTDATAKAFATRGYVALAYSGLGFGKSGCPVSLNDPEIDGRAASGLIDFLGGTRAADDGQPRRLRPQRRRGRPARRDDRRLVRRHRPAGHGRERPPPGRPRAPDHLERPRLLPRPQQRHGRPGRPRRVQVPVDVRLLPHGRGAGPAQPGPRPVPGRWRGLPALRLRGLRDHPSAGLGPLPRRPHRRDARLRAQRLPGLVPPQGQGADTDRPGPGRHPLQPQRGGGDVQGPQGPGHRDPHDLAVLGPQRRPHRPRSR